MHKISSKMWYFSGIVNKLSKKSARMSYSDGKNGNYRYYDFSISDKVGIDDEAPCFETVNEPTLLAKSHAVPMSRV